MDQRIDPRTGFCRENSTFYSKRKPISLPSNESLDVATFISSQPHHGNVAFIDCASGRHLTYSQLWSAVDSVASSLSDMGIKKGQVILILSPNSIFFPIICLSVMYLGAIITTTNPLNTTSEISKQIADSKPVLAFTTRALLPKLVKSNLNTILIDGDEDSDFGKMIRKKPSERQVRERVNQDDTATLLYSSGTTGASKGVVSSHKNIIAMVQNVSRRFSEPNQRFICTVPMFHIYGLAGFATGLLASGTTIIVLSKFEMDEMLWAIVKYRATHLPLVPPIMVGMVKNADRIKPQHGLGSLRAVFCSGAPLSKELIEGFLEKYPSLTILQGYGLTESAGAGSSTDSLEESRRYGTAGLLSPSTEAKIVDPETGVALSVNQPGELWLRGPTIMKGCIFIEKVNTCLGLIFLSGYFGNVEATATTLDSEGWLKTGDLCYIDDDGFIFVVDRLKELIKYKGYQVAPAELEALLLSHPEIADAAVIPFPDEEAGQVPMAYVVRKGGSNLSEATVMNFVATQVAPFKRVRRVSFVTSIPKNPSGKILRKDLIKLAASKI